MMAEQREKENPFAVEKSPMGPRVEDELEMTNTSTLRTAETLLRLLPIAPSLVVLVVMLQNSQTNDFGSISYSHLGAFRYLVHANGICAGYSLLSALVTAMPRPFTMPQAWSFFFFDQLLTYLVLGAGAASTEVLYLAYKGDTAITWGAACESFGKFCHKTTASVAFNFVAAFCYVLISLVSSYKLFSKFDAPASATNPTNANEVAKF